MRLLLACLLLLAASAHAACTGSSPTWSSSADEASIESCIASASTGDTINVAAGSATWSSVALAKSLTLNGAGSSGGTTTDITFDAQHALTITKQAAGVIRIKNFRFLTEQTGETNRSILVQGSWQSAEPVIFQNNHFFQNGTDFFFITVAGGFIFANNIVEDTTAFFAVFHIKAEGDTASWTTADSMGTNDTNGDLNHYIEDNTFTGSPFALLDCDDNCRIVFRYNTSTYGPFNSHGWDTSPYGMRHFEIYNNTWLYVETCDAIGNSANGIIWIRGGTGIIANNTTDNYSGSCWGDKAEMKFDIRSAEDALQSNRQGLPCGSISYPMAHQLGRNHNGTSEFTDPIYLWNNTITSGSMGYNADWHFGNNCGFGDFLSTFFVADRDFVLDQGAKPGWAAYTYPHPLVTGAAVPDAPTGFRLQ